MSSILKVDTIQDQSGNNIINENANTITIGASGDTITIPAGATLSNLGTASGFGIAWQAVHTAATLTAVAGNGYFINTTSNACTVTLPASPSIGQQIQFVDYAGTFDTNALIFNPNGNKIEGGTANLQLTGEREGVTLTFTDATQGWLATSGINEGTDALAPLPYSVDFLVIAGGGSGGGYLGGGGAGGYRNSYSSEPSGGGGSSEASLGFNIGTVYTVTVGAGGTIPSVNTDRGGNGTDSSISGTGITTITSSGGGGGGAVNSPTDAGASGGSGGGGGNSNASGGSGTANQGYAGGTAASDLSTYSSGGGGGGASAVGGNSSSGSPAGSGGNGLASSITGSSVTRGGGGGGGVNEISKTVGSGGTGGGGAGGDAGDNSPQAVAGTANTGGGGGGGIGGSATAPKAGGSGVVILRMPTANYSGTTTGSPTVTTSGADTILVYNASGSITG